MFFFWGTSGSLCHQMMEKNNVVVGCWCIELQYWLLIHYFFVFFSFLEKCFLRMNQINQGYSL